MTLTLSLFCIQITEYEYNSSSFSNGPIERHQYSRGMDLLSHHQQLETSCTLFQTYATAKRF
jgi:hypothetical protein